jgi:cytochrome c oxidase assembly protein subunit 15
MTAVAQLSAPPSPATPSPWPQRLAWLTGVATLLLIMVGGMVTDTGSGLAVPDWPTTFGYSMFTYPLSRMVGGVLYEHSHRLIGSLVGLLTVALCLSLWRAEPRRWVRWLGTAALAGVILQGVLGGLRVVLVQNGLALIHGAVAYAFLGLIACLALVTAPSWQTQPEVEAPAGLGNLRRLALATTAAIYVQILFGAIFTHTGTRLDAHLTFAVLVSVLVLVITARILRLQPARPRLSAPARTLQGLWALQLLLGLGAYVAKFGVEGVPVVTGLGLLFSVAHRLTGGLMLVASLALTLRIVRLSLPTAAAVKLPRPAPGRMAA